MSDLLEGTTLLTSLLAGTVALFAPCCISVMLPAYFASSFRRRTALLSMTGVFALGVGVIILPIALGAAALSRLITGQHFIVFLAGGILMLGMGIAVLVGREVTLPMIGVPVRPGHGAASVFALGAFSGVASACCAPVLAGVITLSGVASSFAIAIVIGIAYVFGMVVPLFVIALLWDRFDWGSSPVLRGRLIRLAVGRRRLAVHTTALASGVLLLAMGILIVVIAFRGPDMSGPGWQASLSSWLQHATHVLVTWLSVLPGWLSGSLVLVALAVIVRKAIRQGSQSSAEVPTPASQAGADEAPPPPGGRPAFRDAPPPSVMHGEGR